MGFCCLCKKKSVRGSGLSFFSFPRDEFLCNEWLKISGFQVHSKNDTTKMKLCSEHFKESSFRITRKDGPKLLKPDAVPFVSGRNSNQVLPISSTVDVDNQTGSKNEMIVPVSIASTSKKPDVLVASEKVNYSKQPNITISVINEQVDAGPSAGRQLFSEEEITPKKRQIWGPRHALEMSPSHFATPQNAKRNLDIIKSDIEKKNARIRQLTSQTSRMRKRIQNLRNLIDHLKHKQLVANSTADILEEDYENEEQNCSQQSAFCNDGDIETTEPPAPNETNLIECNKEILTTIERNEPTRSEVFGAFVTNRLEIVREKSEKAAELLELNLLSIILEAEKKLLQ